MIKWHEIYPGSYEGRVGDGSIILAHVWYDTPLFFGKHKATWRARTSFGGVGVRSYGGAFPTEGEAKAEIEDYLKRVAAAVLEK